MLLVRSGEMAGRRLSVLQSVATIGSWRHADLILPDPGITPLHARLELREGVWTLTVLRNANPVQVDGEQVTSEVPLSPGSTIQLGPVMLLFEPRDTIPHRFGMVDPVDIPVPLPESRTDGRVGRALAILAGIALVAGGILLELFS